MKDFLIKEQSRILTLIHRLMYNISFFISSFLLIYFLKITNWDLKIISMNYIALYIGITTGFFLVGFIIKKSNIFNIYRLGIFMQILYLATIMFMARDIVNYIVLLGAVKGFSDAFYWVPRHYMTYKMNHSKAANKFFSIDQTIAKLQDIILPVLMGGLIGYTTEGYAILIAIMIGILVMAFWVSTWLDLGEDDVESLKVAKLQEFLKIDDIVKLKKAYLSDFFNGLTAGGVLAQVVTIFVYLVYKSELGLGAYSSGIALIIAIITFLMGQYVKDEKFEGVIKISVVFTLIAMVGLIIKVNVATLIFYSIVSGLAFAIMLIIGNANLVKLMRKETTKEYVIEHIMVREVYTNVGRVIGYLVLYYIGNMNSGVDSLRIMLVFLTICIAMRGVEMILSLNKREEHTIHALDIFKLNVKAFHLFLKRQ